MEAMERLSERYLNVPLDAVIQPVSTEVRKVVKEEQVAVNEALVQRWEDIKDIFKPAREKTGIAPASLGKDKPFNPRLFGIGAGILLIAVLGVFDFYLYNNWCDANLYSVGINKHANACPSNFYPSAYSNPRRRQCNDLSRGQHDIAIHIRRRVHNGE
jgi:hypothetical protein